MPSLTSPNKKSHDISSESAPLMLFTLHWCSLIVEKSDGLFGDIYPKELELRVEHRVDHATFFNLDITIKEGTFLYKLFDKRDLSLYRKKKFHKIFFIQQSKVIFYE